MGMMVVDANVAAKWVLDEPDSNLAHHLFVGIDTLLAPQLIRVEVAGAITRAHRIGNMTEQQARQALAAWYDILDSGRLSLIPDEELLSSAIELALSAKHQLIDCMYVAVATQFDVQLITADVPLIERVIATYPRIIPLRKPLAKPR